MDRNSASWAGTRPFSIYVWLLMLKGSRSNVPLPSNRLVGKFYSISIWSLFFDSGGVLLLEYNGTARKIPPSTLLVWIEECICLFFFFPINQLANWKKKVVYDQPKSSQYLFTYFSHSLCLVTLVVTKLWHLRYWISMDNIFGLPTGITCFALLY